MSLTVDEGKAGALKINEFANGIETMRSINNRRRRNWRTQIRQWFREWNYARMVAKGKLEGAGASFKQLTEDECEHLQAQVSQIGAEFCAAVDAKRLDVDTVQGQCFFGGRNVEGGFDLTPESWT